MRKCLFWIDDTDRIILDQKVPEAIGGANVQMAFWQMEFARNNWQVYSFTYSWKNRKAIPGIRFLYLPLIRKVMFFLYNLKFLYLFIYRPSLVITRGVPANITILLWLKKILGYNILHTVASDREIDLDRLENIKSEKIIFEADFVIVQNEIQQTQYVQKFKKSTLVIPNIWNRTIFKAQFLYHEKIDVIWIANLRRLKRAEWFIQLAKRNPDLRFCMVGETLDKLYKREIEIEAKKVNNLTFLGYQSLHAVDQLLAVSRILVCTSEYEGFPNTFLHAWSHGVPVLSTVDPSGIITKLHLGRYCKTLDELNESLQSTIGNQNSYESFQTSINTYFEKSHSPNYSYKQLINFIEKRKG
jgi:glycosyltransferase involved in cell wall biosynthesis